MIILPISDKYNEYAQKVLNQLNNYDIRGRIDDRNEKIGKKIREAELNKITYMLIIGEKEAATGAVAVRHREDGDRGAVPLDRFLDELKVESMVPVFPQR